MPYGLNHDLMCHIDAIHYSIWHVDVSYHLACPTDMSINHRLMCHTDAGHHSMCQIDIIHIHMTHWITNHVGPKL